MQRNCEISCFTTNWIMMMTIPTLASRAKHTIRGELYSHSMTKQTKEMLYAKKKERKKEIDDDDDNHKRKAVNVISTRRFSLFYHIKKKELVSIDVKMMVLGFIIGMHLKSFFFYSCALYMNRGKYFTTLWNFQCLIKYLTVCEWFFYCCLSDSEPVRVYIKDVK